MAIDQMTSVVSYTAALSVATERITEVIKRAPGVSSLLSSPTPAKPGEPVSTKENLRVIGVYVLAVIVGGFLCWQTPAGILPENLHLGPLEYIFFGLLASGGSSFWNSALDGLREAKKQLGKAS